MKKVFLFVMAVLTSIFAMAGSADCKYATLSVEDTDIDNSETTRTDPYIHTAEFNVLNNQIVNLDDEDFTGIKLSVEAKNLPEPLKPYLFYVGGARLYDLDNATGAYTFCSVNTSINCDEIILCPKEKLAKGKHYKLVIPFESLYIHNFMDFTKEVCYFDADEVEFYTVGKDVPFTGASLVAGGQEIALSTETATEFGELPSGSVFKYSVTQADTKTVTFQIYDVTADEILKSVTMKQDENGLSGAVEFSLAIKYELAKDHTYEAQFKEYNAVNGLTIKAPTATANYKFSGMADVAVYSDIKIVSVSPSTSTDVSSTENPIVITFSAPIASLDVKAIIGQMISVNVAASNITSNEDKTEWTVALEKDYFSSATLSLNFYAIDNKGNRVTDPNNGVGTPESCYVNFSWASTIGLPTPTLAQDGKTYETISAIVFKNDGIGLNEDNTTATWQQITIEKDGVPMDLTITHDMFTIGGNASVGGTELTMTLPTLYKGVYTVNVPARAFMLGHDNANTYNGECTFTFTCTEEEAVEPDAIDVIAGSNAADGKYLEGGKVVIVKNGVKYNAAGQIIR